MLRTTPLILLGIALLATGCGGIPRYDVTVTLDAAHIEQTGAIPTIEVNFVGINEAELPQWEKYSVDSYWTPDDALRNFGLARHAANDNDWSATVTTIAQGFCNPAR